MKAKIVIDLPSRDKLLANLSPRELYPALERAERDEREAEIALKCATDELAEHERRVAALPARVVLGEVRSSELANAMRERDATALTIPHRERALSDARARVAAESTASVAAVRREIDRRAEKLEQTAAELAPVLAELSELAIALAKALDARNLFDGLDWPCSGRCHASAAVFAMSHTPTLMWSSKP